MLWKIKENKWITESVELILKMSLIENLSLSLSLRENSTEPPSRKLDSSKCSRQRDESTSSNKDKSDSSNQEATEKENEEKVLDNEEGIQLEDESGLLDEGTDDTAVNTEEEEKKGEEERLEEEGATTADEENRERDSQQNQDEQVSLTLYHITFAC